MRYSLIAISLLCTARMFAQAPAVRASEGTITIPTYEPAGRESEPALFGNSTVAGMYPFTTYVQPYQEGGPKPRTYKAVFLENEYLKLTYIPEFGGRIFSLYDKIRKREVFYRNDVIKPAHYNPRNSWPQSGLELTGPHDLHMLTLHGEPFWSNKTVRNADGSVSLVLGTTDPVYHMKVNLSATLHPGVAALQIGVFCYNTRTARMPQMFWINTAVPATPKSRFIYPMTRTVGHTTADIADWPVHNGIDYSWDRNNLHMLGVFGIDIYDDFHGAYQFENDYGVFRYADRRVVQGMKLWTFGNGETGRSVERGYTDNAGPYIELQSGRHVWDGHYEWVAPNKAESWSEWWVPVAGTGGLTTLTRDSALNLTVKSDPNGGPSSVEIILAPTRKVAGAKLTVTASSGELLRATLSLDPAKPYRAVIPGIKPGLLALRVTLTDATGKPLLDYLRPDADPGRKEYTPFTRPLEASKKSPDQMGAEELTLAGEYRLKELDGGGAEALFERALKLDPGYSRAHVQLGIHQFTAGRFADAEQRLKKAIERDPYNSEAYYYLGLCQMALDRNGEAERNLYYIWPESAYFSLREYQLGRLAMLAQDSVPAISHLKRAIVANGNHLSARVLLALAYRERGERAAALAQLAEIERIDATNVPAQAERFLLAGDAASRAVLLKLLGGQSQEAIGLSQFYRDVNRWKYAVRVLQLVEQSNNDPWGTPPEFYYTLAYCQRRAGLEPAAKTAMARARAAYGKIDRFPYRDESEAPLAEAVRLDPSDSVARFNLACLLYFRGRRGAAIAQWEAAVKFNPADFASRRALGLAYAEQGSPVERSAEQLERAVELNPSHLRTLSDLSNLYARAGKFDEQLSVLSKALTRSPGDDVLAEGIIAAHLARGDYAEAARVVDTHKFAPRHRTYGLRDKYRMMRYGQGAGAFRQGDYGRALELFQSARKPPVTLGMDDFESQVSPRLQYYLGRALEASGKAAEAKEAYEKGIANMQSLSGDRDSWSPDNFFMVATLDRLGRAAEGVRLSKRFEDFANGEVNDRNSERRAEARYLLSLVRLHEGRADESRQLMRQALEAVPDHIPALLEMRGDTLSVVASAK
ncbi:MAG TPA: DUF5107 domain-containing protein [Bryobacteraceae bacterium]|nr:DUF5107 domain-containing protein [Bryobacteraceae bacterium]